MKLNLECKTCGRTCADTEKADSKSASPFLFRGYDKSLAWSDFIDRVPDLENHSWERSNTPPKAGEGRLVKIKYPFCQSSEETFWTLYQPAWSSRSGWGDYPEEIDLSAFVECRLTDVVSSTPYEAWARVKVERVIKLSDACSVFPTNSDDREFVNTLLEFTQNRDVTVYENWILFSASFEGDIGQWALVTTKDNNYHLVMFGNWGFDESTAYFGNLFQSKECVDNLIELFRYEGGATL